MELLMLYFKKFLSSFEHSLDILFLNALDMTFTVSMIIIVIFGIRFLFHKAPKIFSYALWSTVLIRLLCPFSLETPMGIFSQNNTIANSYTLANKPISFLSSVESVYQATGDVTFQWWEFLVFFGKYIWMAGIVILLTYNLLSLHQLRRKLVGAVPLSPNIYESDYIDFPFTLGLFFPKVYLPSSLSRTEQPYIIEHEQHHIQRGDHIIKFLAFIALCLHWFNPFVWIAFFLATKDLEMSCDEAVVKKAYINNQDIRQEYASSILNLSVGKAKAKKLATILSFTEVNPKERVNNIMNSKKMNRWIVILCSIVVAFIVILFISNPFSNKSTKVEEGIYQVEDIIYNIYDNDKVPFSSQSQFRVTEDYELYRKDSSNETWELLGILESYPLTKKELNSYLSMSSWVVSYPLREITDAYILRVADNMFYYIMQTRNGDTLLSYGWEDVGERNDAFSDDTSVNIIMKLCKK